MKLINDVTKKFEERALINLKCYNQAAEELDKLNNELKECKRKDDVAWTEDWTKRYNHNFFLRTIASVSLEEDTLILAYLTGLEVKEIMDILQKGELKYDKKTND